MPNQASISAIVPARNEESVIAACVESLARQPEIGEILVVDDQSTDGTAAILGQLAAHVPQLRVLQAGPVPAGWVGKNHAISLGAAQARGGWLLFTDADSVHLEGSAARALELAQEWDAALVSFSPEQVTETWWEKALIPYIYCRLAARFSYKEVNNPDSPAAAANGQYMLMRRDAYEAIGGHASVAAEILEDVAIARRVKSAGYRIWFGSGNSIVRVRMYRSFGAMWEGWRKNLYPLMGGSPAAMAGELLSSVPWVPFFLLLLFVPSGYLWHVLAALGLLLLLGRHAAYAAMLARNQYPVSRILYYVPAVLLYGGVLVGSWRTHGRGRVTWKGREYPVGTPAAEGEGH